MSRVLLITGGAGFIGSNFVRYWMDRCPDDRIIVLDALTYAGNLANLDSVRQNPSLRFYPGRIEDETVIDGLFRSDHPTHVLNFAAESHNDRSGFNPSALIATNVSGVSVLLNAARKHRVTRFLQVSTDEVYGEITTGLFSEEDPLQPRTLYSAAKAGGELQVRAFSIAYGLDVVTTRGSNTYGPYQYPEKLLPFFITRAIQDKKLPLYGSGSQMRDWIFVQDHCEGIATALERGVSGEAYNVGGENDRPNLEVVQRVLELLGKPHSLIKQIHDPRGKSHDQRYALDNTRLRALGWRPRSDFVQQLEATVRWYQANEAWWRPLVEDSGYQQFVSRYYGKYLGEDL